MNKSLLSGFIGGLLAASLFVLPGWAIFWLVWFSVGYLVFKASSIVDNIGGEDKIILTIFGFGSIIIALIVLKTDFLVGVWRLFSDKSPPKFRSPIYFEEENLTEES